VIERYDLISAVESIKGEKAYQKSGLQLSIGALDVVHRRDTEKYQDVAASFFEKIKVAKEQNFFTSMIVDALVTSAFGLEEKQTGTSFISISTKALRGEISAKDFVEAAEKERGTISANFGNARDIAESLRPKL